jgi:cob(I)alamin adenosyltransferase
MNRSQVTTRRGDAGETTALSGDALSKGHPILECTGCVDELRAHTAFARLLLVEERLDDPERLADFLLWLLHAYFAIGSACSDPLDKHPEWRKVDISAEHLRHLESVQARLEEKTKTAAAIHRVGHNSPCRAARHNLHRGAAPRAERRPAQGSRPRVARRRHHPVPEPPQRLPVHSGAVC